MQPDRRRRPSTALAATAVHSPPPPGLRLVPRADPGDQREGPWRALQYLGGCSPGEARRWAAALLRLPTLCTCCRSLLAHVELRLGSTFYYDDDPVKLAQAFPPGERAAFTPQLLAACVLLRGRERVCLYPPG